MSSIEDFLKRYGAQVVSHASLLEPGQTVVITPTEKMKKNYRTDDILLTLLKIPAEAAYIPQSDRNGILYLVGELEVHDIVPVGKGFAKRMPYDAPDQITDCMTGELRVYHIPEGSAISKFLEAASNTKL